MPLSDTDIRRSHELVIDVFRGFQGELMRSYGSVDHTSKHDGSPVTDLDVAIETALKKRLQTEFPEIGFHGEETDDIASDIGATWIVDPIDGTSSYIHGLPYCANMAGLVVDGVIVASVIYLFATNDMFTAIRGEGAYKNDQLIHIKDLPLDSSVIFGGSFAYRNLHPLLQPHSTLIYAPIGASGYEFALLAQGSIQGVTKLVCRSQIHDNVPGVLLTQEAGAEIVTFSDEPYNYTMLNFVVASPTVATLMRAHTDEIAHLITHTT